MSKSNQGQGASFSFGDPEILIGGAVVMYVLSWAAWKFGHEHISLIYTYIRYVQAYLFYILSSNFPETPVLSSAYTYVNKLCDPASGLFGFCRRDFSVMTWQEIENTTFPWGIGFFVLMVIFCIKAFLKTENEHPNSKFTKTHNIHSFIKESKALYPHLNMFSTLDLVGEPLTHPLFGMSLGSRHLGDKYKLVKGWEELPDRSFKPILDRERIEQLMLVQMGDLWVGWKNLQIAEKLIFAATIPLVAATDPDMNNEEFKKAKAASAEMIEYCWSLFKSPPPKAKAKKAKKGEEIKEEVPISYFSWLQDPEIDLTIVEKVIDQYKQSKAVKEIIQKHAYVRTILYSLFLQSRRLGVLQPAEFRWLRFYNRPLWYVVNSIGRQAPFGEAAAVYCHYLYETKSETALTEPQIDKAVEGLINAIQNYRYTDRSLVAKDKTNAYWDNLDDLYPQFKTSTE